MKAPGRSQGLSRREFLTRTACTAAIVAVGGLGGVVAANGVALSARGNGCVTLRDRRRPGRGRRPRGRTEIG